MTWEKDWAKTWFTVDPGTVVIARADTGGATNVRYIPALFAIKDRLTSAGVGAWTVLASSGKGGGGSLVANTSDNWLSADDLVSATADTLPRSWILLKSPERRVGSYYLLIDFWGTSELYCNWYFTKDQPDISSPLTTARPPATGNEWSHLAQYIVRSSTSTQYITSMVAVRAHDGSFVIGFSAPLVEEHTTNKLYMLNVLRNPKPWDTVGAVTLIQGATTRIRHNTTITFKSLHSTGAAVDIQPVWFECQTTSIMPYNLTDPWVDKWLTYPVPLLSVTAGTKTFRGDLEDIYWLGDLSGDGTLMYANGVVKAMRIGNFSIPFDQVGGFA